jgi:arsenate reductase-like glutaredoxin family protein
MAPSPAPAGPQVQIFGLESDRATRAAIRFFKERRIAIHLVDVRRKRIAPGELRRFVERLGAGSLADTEGMAWRDGGLGYLKMTDADLAQRLLDQPRLLRLPLVRFGNSVSAGRAEATWKAWLSAEG